MIDLVNTSPHALAEQLLISTGHYARAAEELAELLEKKAHIWLELRKDYTSDSQTDKAWTRTEDGVRESRLKLLLKSKEKEMSVIKTYLRVKEAETRGSY